MRLLYLTNKFITVFALNMVFFFSSDLLAQQMEKRFYHLTIEEGLSQSTVMAIFQDSQGYMWFGTQDGLNRYDGYNFITYRYEPDNPQSISDNDIRTIYEDHRGDLWIGTQRRGLNRYNRELDRFERFIGEADEWETLSSNTVWTLLEDSEGLFWVGTGSGLNLMDRDNKKFRRILHEPGNPESLSSNQISRLYEDRNNTLWIGTAEGLNKLNRDEGTFERINRISIDGDSLTLGRVREIYEDQLGNFWFGTETKGLFLFDRDNHEFEQFTHDPDNPRSISNNSIFGIHEDKSGNLWIGTGSQGLNIFDRNERIFHTFRHRPENSYSINNNSVNSLYVSRENILWAGTFAGGVNFHELRPEPFRQFRNEPENPESLNNNVVQAIFQDGNDQIWIGTDGGGLNLFNPQTETFRHFQHQANDPGSISSNVVLDIHETERGLWLATYGGGVDLFNTESITFQNFSHNQNDTTSLSSNNVYVIHESRDGYLWFGTNWGGVSKMAPGSEVFQHLRANPENPEDEYSLRNDDVRLIFEDRYGDIWIGSYGGNLDRYQRESGRITNYDMNQESTYLGSVAQVMLEDENGTLLVGTRGAGILWFNREKDRFEPLATTADGLPSNVIQSMTKDGFGNLWLSTHNGIARYNPDSGEVRIYREGHGLRNREFNPGSALQDPYGLIYFGGVNGFVRFHPDSLRISTETPAPKLSELLFYNEPIQPGEDSLLPNQISQTEKLTLPHHISVITLGYTALDFGILKGNSFTYKLEGFEDNWNFVGSQRQATYTNLNPGNYTFMVRAANSDGVWSEPATLSITITPPFWKTAWFIGLMVLLSAVLIFGVYRFRIQQIRKLNIELERTVRQRTQELRQSNETKNKLFSVIAHDLRNIASGINGWSSLLKESAESGRYDEVKEYVHYMHDATTQFSSFLNNILDWARSQSKSIQPRPELLKAAAVIAEAVEQEQTKALNKEIEIHQQTDPSINIFADPDMISVVLRNLLHNAIKFTEKDGQIKITTEKTGLNQDSVVISITDTGVGMDKKTVEKLLDADEYISSRGTSGEKGTGIGFTLCKDFVRRNQGHIEIESEPGRGTTVRLILQGDKAEQLSPVG